MKSLVIALVALLPAGSWAQAQSAASVDACVVRETADWLPPTTLDGAIAMRASLGEIIDACRREHGSSPGEDGVWFGVIPIDTVNSRACPGTACARVGQVEGGAAVSVYGVERDSQDRGWYSLDREGSTWIAAWLTRGGPDAIIDVEAPHADARTGCNVFVHHVPQSRDRMTFLVSGPQQTRVVPGLYLPGATEPLPAHGQSYRTFDDSEDETYILRGHSLDTVYPNGLYRIGIEIKGDRSVVGFLKEGTGLYDLHVIC